MAGSYGGGRGGRGGDEAEVREWVSGGDHGEIDGECLERDNGDTGKRNLVSTLVIHMVEEHGMVRILQ